jgi:glutamine cyclotransferase
MKTMMMLTIAVLMTMTMAKSEDVATKVTNHLSNEIVKTKEYQAKSWAEGKEQLSNTINKIKLLFAKKQ